MTARADVPLVSIVIPSHDQGRFVDDAIASARNQTWPGSEIVVIDDGSTDATAASAARHADVRVVRQSRSGLGAARNRGLRESRGAYLVFLDADDMLWREAVAAGLAAFRQRPESAFVFGDYRYVDAAGAVLRASEWTGLPRGDYASLLRGNCIGMHATVMYRRGTLERFGGFDVGRRAAEDYDLYLRVTRDLPVHYHPALVADYRQHGANMSRDAGLMLRSVLAVLRAQRAHVRGDTRLRLAYREGVANWRAHYGELLRERLRARLADGCAVPAMQTAVELLRADGRRALRDAWRRVTGVRAPTPGARVRLGTFGRSTPVSRRFGFDRGQPVDRYYIERFLAEHAADVRGRVLEVGDDTYTWRFGADHLARSDVLHVSDDRPPATFVGTLADAPALPSDAFDCVILTQTLHLVEDVRAAVATVRRILRPGGVALVTVPGISQSADDQWRDTWMWGFTAHSARRLFWEHFPESHVTVEARGNVLAATAFLHGVAAEELRGHELDRADAAFPVSLLIRAVKPRAA